MLGPVEALKKGQPVALGGARQRALLALLVLRYGRIVPVAELIDAIWTGEPPERAATTLRSYVSRLRSALGEAARVSGSASGYAINVDPETIDAALFEKLVRAADDDLTRERAAAAADHLDHALGLWRGRAFGHLSDYGAFRAEAERLDALRLHAVEQRFEAAIALGRAAEVLDEIQSETALHPNRGRLHDLLRRAVEDSSAPPVAPGPKASIRG